MGSMRDRLGCLGGDRLSTVNSGPPAPLPRFLLADSLPVQAAAACKEYTEDWGRFSQRT
jgi:hypothetical protein